MARNIDVTLTLNTKGFNRKLKQAESSMAGFGGKANMAKGSIIGLAARFAPLAAGLVAVGAGFKGLSASVQSARQIEDLGVVLRNIVGDAEGGAMALQMVKDIATELPFAFTEIAGATPALATVSANLQELEDNTKLAADIAATTGLSFQDASSQIQRAFSAGAGAADMFREKGVLSMAGFEAGASYSIEETRKKFREFGKTVEGAAKDLNDTLTGNLSQAGDRFDQFKIAMGDAIVPELTAFIKTLVSVFDENNVAIKDFAKSMGEGVVNAFYGVLEVGAVLIDYFTMLFNALKAVAQFVNDKFGEVFYVVFNSIAKVVGGVVEAVAFLGKGIGKIIELAGGDDTVTTFFDNIQNAANKVRTDGLDKFGEALDDMFNAVPVTTAQDFVDQLIKDLRAAGDEADEAAEAIAKALENQKTKAETTIQASGDGLTNSLSDYKSASEELLSSFSSATQKLSDDLATALLSGQDVMSSFKDFFKTIIKEIIAQALRLAVIQPLLSSIFGAFGFNIGFTGSGGIDSITKRERGGNVMRNKPYLVGERGPELMVPLTSGTVVPNDALGTGNSRNYVTYNIQAVDARSFKQLVAQDPEFIYNVTRIGERRLPA